MKVASFAGVPALSGWTNAAAGVLHENQPNVVRFVIHLPPPLGILGGGQRRIRSRHLLSRQTPPNMLRCVRYCARSHAKTLRMRVKSFAGFAKKVAELRQSCESWGGSYGLVRQAL